MHAFVFCLNISLSLGLSLSQSLKSILCLRLKTVICRIETHGTLQLDDKRRITKYVSNDGNFKLEGIRRNVHKKEATGPEYTRFMDFLIKTTKEAVEPMRVWLVHNEFKRQEGRKFSKSGYAKR